MSEPTQRMIESNGIRLNIAEQGKGPLVLLCHGFPESWYSWRHQIEALAAAGFHAVALDMRGYGKSDAPEAIDQYTIFHLVGDLVGQHTNSQIVFLSSVFVREYVAVSGYKRCMMEEGYTEGGFWKGYSGWRDE